MMINPNSYRKTDYIEKEIDDIWQKIEIANNTVKHLFKNYSNYNSNSYKENINRTNELLNKLKIRLSKVEKENIKNLKLKDKINQLTIKLKIFESKIESLKMHESRLESPHIDLHDTRSYTSQFLSRDPSGISHEITLRETGEKVILRHANRTLVSYAQDGKPIVTYTEFPNIKKDIETMKQFHHSNILGIKGSGHSYVDEYIITKQGEIRELPKDLIDQNPIYLEVEKEQMVIGTYELLETTKGNLEEILKSPQTISDSEKTRCIREITAGLEHMQTKEGGYVHSNLSSANILMGKLDNSYKIANFDCTYKIGSQEDFERVNEAILPPEVVFCKIRGKDIKDLGREIESGPLKKIDHWSLGLIAAQMLNPKAVEAFQREYINLIDASKYSLNPQEREEQIQTNVNALLKELFHSLTAQVSPEKEIIFKLYLVAKGLLKLDPEDRIELRDVQNILKEVDINMKNESKASSFRSLMDIPSLIKLMEAKSEVIQITVLDQTSLPGGNDNCGYHSWKNALVALALSNPLASEELVLLFQDPDFFTKEVEPFLNTFNPEGGDIPLTALTDATHKLIQEGVNQDLYPNLHKLSTLLQSNRDSISFLNTAIKDQPQMPYDLAMRNIVWENDAISGGSNSLTMNNISSSIQALQEPGFITHAFVSGTGGHWVTLIMQKNREETKWFGTDSWHNQAKVIPNHQRIITQLESNPQFKSEVIRKEYDEAIGIDMRKLATKLNEEGDPIPPLTTNQLVESFDITLLNIDKIVKGFKFLKDLNLSETPAYTTDYQQLKKSALFYQHYLSELPDLESPEALDLFFSTYAPYAILDPEYFEKTLISSPLLKSIPTLYEISGLEVDNLEPLETELENFRLLGHLSSAKQYEIILQKFFDKHGRSLIAQLETKGLFGTETPKNSRMAIAKLITQPSLPQMQEIINIIREINQQRLANFINKNELNSPDLAQLPHKLEEALALIKRAAFEKNKGALRTKIDADKEIVKRDFISQKKQLQKQLANLI